MGEIDTDASVSTEYELLVAGEKVVPVSPDASDTRSVNSFKSDDDSENDDESSCGASLQEVNGAGEDEEDLREAYVALKADHKRIQEESMKTVLSMRRVMADISVKNDGNVRSLKKQIKKLQADLKPFKGITIEDIHATEEKMTKQGEEISNLQVVLSEAEKNHKELEQEYEKQILTLKEDYENQVLSLKGEMDTLQSTLDEKVLTTKATLDEKVDALQSSLNEKDAELDAKDAALDARDAALEAKDAALDEKDVALDEKEAFLVEVRRELRSMEEKHQNLEEEILALNGKNDSLLAALDEKDNVLAEAQNEWQEQQQALESEQTVLQSKVSDFRCRNKSLEVEHEKHQKEVQSLRLALEKKDFDEEEIKKELGLRQDSLANAKKLIASMEISKNNAVSDLQETIKEKDKRILRLEENLRLDIDLINTSDEDLSPLVQAKVLQLRTAVDESKIENEKLEERFAESALKSQEERAELQRVIDKLRGELSDAQSAASQVLQEKQHKEKSFFNSEQTINSLREEKKALESEKEVRLKEADDIIRDLEKSNSDLDAQIEQMIASHEDEMAGLEMEMNGLRKRYKSLVRELERMQKDTERGPVGTFVAQSADAMDQFFHCNESRGFSDNLGRNKEDIHWINKIFK